MLLIASFLEPKLVRRIEQATNKVQVVYRPELLPVPQYPGDHAARPRAVTPQKIEAWKHLLVEAEIMFDFDWYSPEDLPLNAPNLQWVQGTSAGIGEFLTSTGLAKSDIIFTTASGVHAKPLSEFAVLGSLYFVKDMPQLLHRQKRHDWKRIAVTELAGQRALIVGLGNVGKAIAQQFNALGIHVRAVRRSPTKEEIPEYVLDVKSYSDISEWLPKTDILVLSCPLTEATDNLIGEKELRQLPPSCVIINVARGAVINQPALYRSLRDKAITGAALDVFTQEPLPPDDPLWDLPNVLISPHSASTVDLETERIVELLILNLKRYLAGTSLVNQYDAVAGY